MIKFICTPLNMITFLGGPHPLWGRVVIFADLALLASFCFFLDGVLPLPFSGTYEDEDKNSTMFCVYSINSW